ncbi:MAG: hypothetical protein WCT26_04780 [Candidatus Buchananbacteria bacterium]|jgi:phosphohistidine phosphatase SixA
MKTPVQLVLIHPGQSEPLNGIPDNPLVLTERGIWQARSTSNCTRTWHGVFDAFYASRNERESQMRDYILETYKPEERARIHIYRSDLLDNEERTGEFIDLLNRLHAGQSVAVISNARLLAELQKVFAPSAPAIDSVKLEECGLTVYHYNPATGKFELKISNTSYW